VKEKEEEVKEKKVRCAGRYSVGGRSD